MNLDFQFYQTFRSIWCLGNGGNYRLITLNDLSKVGGFIGTVSH